MNAAQLLVKCLEVERIKYIFGLPGEENLAFLEALRSSSITFIVTRHEQAAVFMAATVGRLTGKVGVALTTLGPGATNTVTGVAHAQLGGMPLLIITGQKPVRTSKQGAFQLIDIVQLMKPITKMSATITSAARVPAIIHEAIKLAESERPGAVHLELPEDIADEETEAKPFLPIKVRRPSPDIKAVSEAVSAIEKAKHPLILLAAGANRKLVRDSLRAFIEKTGIPFVTTQMGKGVEDEGSDKYLGTAALSDNDYVHCALHYADLILVVGHDISEKPPVILTTQTHTVIHVNFFEATTDDVYVPTLEIIGDIAASVKAITKDIKPQTSWDLDYFERLRNFLQEHIKIKTTDAEFPPKPQRIVADLRAVMPRDGILSLDNGMFKIWIARNYPAFEQNTVLLDNALATMGAGLSAGIAAKLLNPSRKVVVVAGDGGFMMSVGELETAKRLGLDLVVLLLRDDSFGMIRWKQEELGLPNFGLNFTNPDFIKLAESFGAKGYRITETESLRPTLEKAFNESGIQFIDCPIDYSENAKVFGEELREKTCNL